MVHGFPLDREAGLLIAVHDALPLQTELLAHVALSREAVLAALAFPNEDGEHMIPNLEFGHPFTHTLYHSRDQGVPIGMKGVKGDQGAHPDASWPKILGNRSESAAVVRTLDCHAVTSLRQTEVETTLTRISVGPGGATSTSSITSGCPGPQATAAARKPSNFTRYTSIWYTEQWQKRVAARNLAGWVSTSAGDGGRRRRRCSILGRQRLLYGMGLVFAMQSGGVKSCLRFVSMVAAAREKG
nr:unnamed protein product [Digitaria exilis]